MPGPITWQNVPGADLNGPLAGIRSAADLFQRAGQDASGVVDSIGATKAAVDSIKQAEQDRQVTQAMLGAPDARSYDKLLAGGLAQGKLPDGSQVSLTPGEMVALDAHKGDLAKREKTAQDTYETGLLRAREHADWGAEDKAAPFVLKWSGTAVHNTDKALQGLAGDLQTAGVPLGSALKILHTTRSLWEDPSSHLAASLELRKFGIQQASANLADRVINNTGNNPDLIQGEYSAVKGPDAGLIHTGADLLLSHAEKAGTPFFQQERTPGRTFGVDANVENNFLNGEPADKVDHLIESAASKVLSTPPSEFESLFDAADKNSTSIQKIKAPGKNTGTVLQSVTKLPSSAVDAARGLQGRLGLSKDPNAEGVIKDAIDVAIKAAPKLNYAQAAELVGSQVGEGRWFTINDLGKLDFNGIREYHNIEEKAKAMAADLSAYQNRREAKGLYNELGKLRVQRNSTAGELSQLQAIAGHDPLRARGIPAKGAELLKIEEMIRSKIGELDSKNPSFVADTEN